MKKPIDVLKTYFETGDTPTESQFADLIDSFIHKDEGFVITGTENTPEGLIITFSDGSTETLPIFVLENQEISFINGLQDFIDDVSNFITNLQLTDNNFTNQNLQDLNTMLEFFNEFSSFTGELSVLTYSFGTFINNGGLTPSDLVASITPPITIEKGQLLRIFYKEADFSDGNKALKDLSATFALASGTYGLGQENEGIENAIITKDGYNSDTRTLILNRDFKGFGINRAFISGNFYDTQNQATFNVKAYQYLNGVNLAAKSLRYLQVTEEEIEFEDPELANEFNGTTIKAHLNFSPTGEDYTDGEGFNSVLVLENESATAGTFIKVSIGYFGSFKGSFFPAIKLTKTTSGTETIRYAKITAWSPEENEGIETNFEMFVEFGFDGTTLAGFIVVNNQSFDLEDDTKVEILNVSQAEPFTPTSSVKIGFPSQNTAKFSLKYFNYNINTSETERNYFWLNESGATFKNEKRTITVNKNSAATVDALKGGRLYYKTNVNKFSNEMKSLLIDDLVDFIRGDEPKIYKATTNQSAGDDPTATVLKNTIGNIVWTRDDDGFYIGTLAGAFPENKTFVLVQNFYSSSGDKIYAYRSNNDTIVIETQSALNVGTDSILTKVSILIEVYD